MEQVDIFMLTLTQSNHNEQKTGNLFRMPVSLVVNGNCIIMKVLDKRIYKIKCFDNSLLLVEANLVPYGVCILWLQ